MAMKRRISASMIGCIVFFGVCSFHQIFLSSNIKEKERFWVTSNKLSVSCDRSHHRYDICSLNNPTLVFPKPSTLLLLDSTNSPINFTTQKIRPYPRKWEDNIMSRIKEITIAIASPTSTLEAACQHHHNARAIVFSNGGYTGNLFHDFNDGLIPLFITSHTIASKHGYPVLVIVNCHEWWLSKYANLLHALTPYPIINLDNETDIHCFPSATVGLISHGYASINPSSMPKSESLRDFHSFLDQSYKAAVRPQASPAATMARPHLVLLGREHSHGRAILNQAEVVHLAEEVGFEVTVFKPTASTSLQQAYWLINSSHAMLGVHGAALTHLYFLQPGAVLIQVVPLGLEWAAEVCYGEPAKQMGVDYMEYKIGVGESSLVEKYGKNDVVLKNPQAVGKKGWSHMKGIYLKSQDVRLDLNRVRTVMEVAHKKAMRLMERGF